jgi:hypothetical protein
VLDIFCILSVLVVIFMQAWKSTPHRDDSGNGVMIFGAAGAAPALETPDEMIPTA